MTVPTLDQCRGIAHKLVQHYPDSIEPFIPGVGGDDSYNFLLWYGQTQMLLKVKKYPNTPVGLYFYRRIKEAGIPVPELFAYSPDAGPDGQTCAVWEWIEGRPAVWESGEPCPYPEAEFGKILRRIHELKFDGQFGLLGDDLSARSFTSHPDINPVAATWLNLFRFDQTAERYYAKGYLERREVDILLALPDYIKNYFIGVEPHLLHMGDIMHHGNMLIDPRTRRIVAVVDYVESMAGDPRLELACIDFYFTHFPFNRPNFNMSEFRESYGTRHDPEDPIGQFYLLSILVFEKLLFFDPHSPRGQWAIKTVKGILNKSLY